LGDARDSDGLQGDVEGFESAQGEQGPERGLRACELDRACALEEVGEGARGFQARERRPDAVVCSAAEADRLGVLASDIEAVWIGVTTRVAVRHRAADTDDDSGSTWTPAIEVRSRATRAASWTGAS
jgi:hypothetical protein